MNIELDDYSQTEAFEETELQESSKIETFELTEYFCCAILLEQQ